LTKKKTEKENFNQNTLFRESERMFFFKFILMFI
jgi:hypothetical protein